ncbi:MAG: site-2 protease family protein [Thermodesulfobacteriota bacterium]
MDIARIIQEIALITPGFLVAITVHEYAHGYVALRLGDPTAKLEGRLTFNPISHLDPVGTIVLLLTRTIGWAKPVPVDPRYLMNPRKDMMWISLAGPAANVIAATALAIGLHLIGLILELRGFERYSLMGSAIGILLFGVKINVLLAIFNLIPVHPLDGSKILTGLLPRHLAYEYEKLEPYGFLILILLLFVAPSVGFDIVRLAVLPPADLLFRLLLLGL